MLLMRIRHRDRMKGEEKVLIGKMKQREVDAPYISKTEIRRAGMQGRCREDADLPDCRASSRLSWRRCAC